MTEKACENCFWFEGKSHNYRGFCRNPRNASIGSAGSEYSRADILKPMDAAMNMVCNFHEEKTTGGNGLKEAYTVKAVENPNRRGPYDAWTWVKV